MSGLIAIAAILVMAFSIYAIENPAPSSPGSMGGGFVFVFALVLGIPAAILGLIAFFAMCYFLYKADRKSDAEIPSRIPRKSVGPILPEE